MIIKPDTYAIPISDFYLTSIKEISVADITEFRKEFAELIGLPEGKTAIFVIDNLDRCSPERIIDTLEAIKLFLSVEGTVFLIAADEDIIKYSIESRYPGLLKQENIYGSEYIEKIIQLPIRIPSLSIKDVKNYLILLEDQKYLKPDKLIRLISNIQEKKLHICFVLPHRIYIKPTAPKCSIPIFL